MKSSNIIQYCIWEIMKVHTFPQENKLCLYGNMEVKKVSEWPIRKIALHYFKNHLFSGLFYWLIDWLTFSDKCRLGLQAWFFCCYTVYCFCLCCAFWHATVCMDHELHPISFRWQWKALSQWICVCGLPVNYLHFFIVSGSICRGASTSLAAGT